MPVAMITPEGLIRSQGPYVSMLQEAGFDVIYPKDTTFTRGQHTFEQHVETLKDVEGLIAGGEILSEKVLESLPKLRVIARSGVGFDKVDVAACTKFGKVLTITPTANHAAVAEHALSLLFAISKEVLFNDEEARAGRWPMKPTYPIRGKTICIVGLGRIGRSMAERSLALGMKVIAVEQYPNKEFVEKHGIELVDMDGMVELSDIVSIHCPLMPETKHLFNKSVFSRMKEGSILINTARGPIVKEDDLIDALRNGPLMAAGLDVFEVEPVKMDNPVFQLKNVVVSPHIGGSDTKSQEDMGIEAADCIIQLKDGTWPAAAVINQDVQEGWTW